MLGPDTDETQRCVVSSISAAVGGGSIESLASWGRQRFGKTCAGSDLFSAMTVRPGSPRRVNLCGNRTFEQFLDTDPFVRADVPIVGIYDFPGAKERALSDVDAYFAEYRVLAAYAVALDHVIPL